MIAAGLTQAPADPVTAEALDFARQLAGLGIPVFSAPPKPGKPGKFHLPPNWQQTRPGQSSINSWRPGWMLGMVCGRGLDLIDIDVYNGGDEKALVTAIGGELPRVYAMAATPSGGMHLFTSPIGTSSKNGVLKGVDVKSGDPQGKGRGFAYIAPTVRPSKVTGELGAYLWMTAAGMGAWQRDRGKPDAGADALREYIAASRAPKAAPVRERNPTTAEFMAAGGDSPWRDVAGTLAEGRNDGTMRLASSLRATKGAGYTVRDAIDYMTANAWPVAARTSRAGDFSYAEFCAVIESVWGRYPAGRPAPVTLSAAVAQAPVFASEAEGIASAERADPDDFFDKNGLKAVSAAVAVEAAGRLGAGVDNRMWKYAAGVWLPDAHVVSRRMVALLGERHRKGHTGTVEDVVSAACYQRGDIITAEPVGQYLNVVNGLLDWRTGRLIAHTPDVRTTVQLAVAWNPGAKCTRFDQWLTEVLPADCVALGWEVIAYLVYSGNPFHKAVMLDGTGRNGKGTFLRTNEGIIGKRNISAVSLKDLTDNRFAAAGLVGKLANIAGDIDGTYLESTARFKAITGGDLITAEHKGRDAFEFVPWAVPVFSANKVPASADTSAGYLSRWVVLPFPNSFEGREDRKLDAMIAAEYEGILAKAVTYLPGLLDRGNFSVSESAAAAKAKFDRNVDPVRAWREECCTTGDGWTERGRLFASYEIWAGEERRWKMARAAFYDRLRGLPGVQRSDRGAAGRGFTGLELPPPVQPGWVDGR